MLFCLKDLEHLYSFHRIFYIYRFLPEPPMILVVLGVFSLTISCGYAVTNMKALIDKHELPSEFNLKKYCITGSKFLISFVILCFAVILTYIILGFTLGLWGQAWVLFFLIVLVPETVKLCLYGKWNRYPYPVLVAFTYLLLCVWILKGWWHPLWVIFLTIPIYYSIANIGKMKKK